jgi:hypothetical protein
MIHRRGAVSVLVVLLLVVFGIVLQTVGGPAAAQPDPQPMVDARPTPAPRTGDARAVLRSLAVVRRAYDIGDVRRLCRPGALVDPAVIQAQNAGPAGCESEIESLIASRPRLQLKVHGVAVRPDLATVDVSTVSGSGASVDFVRRGRRWLLSFSAGQDPIPALAGAQ